MKKELQPGARIAVVGAGVSGVVAAYLLDSLQKYDVTLLESNSRLGGHTNTVTITDGEDAGVAVDTGFIVLNNRTYPYFNHFLAKLGVKIRNSDMSFSFEDRQSGFAFAGTTFNGLFAERRNLLSPRFYKLLAEIVRFGSEGRAFLARHSDFSSGDVSKYSLAEFVSEHKFSNFMRDCYLLPISAAIWSAPLRTVLDYPAHSFLSFFSNHGLLSFRNRPTWQTVIGGSHQYLRAFSSVFTGTVRLNSKVQSVQSPAGGEQGVIITLAEGESLSFDAAVIATHADQALRLLKDPTPLEQQLLGKWRYQPNRAVLHYDESFLPHNRRAWAAWNYVSEPAIQADRAVAVTYHMNRLQGLSTSREYCVTLNPIRPVPEKRIIAEFDYEHPVYCAESVATQSRLAELQGMVGRYYCGSYFGYGFHEDGVRSALRVGTLFGASL